MDSDRRILVGFLPGDRIGNLSREVSRIIAPLMDQCSGSDSCMKDNKIYSVGYDFRCVLSSVDLNHSRDGYSIEIGVSTINSSAWVEELYAEICKNIKADSTTLLKSQFRNCALKLILYCLEDL